MTTFEDVARAKLTLVVDNTERRQIPFAHSGIGYLIGLLAGVAFMYVVGWPIVCLLFSLE